MFRRSVNLVGAKLDLESAPLAVGQFNDGINFLIFVVLIVVEAAAKGCGIDAQIPLTKGLKQKAQGFQISQQSSGGGVQQSAGKRWITEVPFFPLLYPHRGTDAYREWGLVICDEQSAENIQISCNGIGVDVLIVYRFDILHQGLIGDSGAFIAGQRA